MKELARDNYLNYSRNNKNRKEERDVRYSESRKHRIASLTGYELGGTVTERRYQKMS